MLFMSLPYHYPKVNIVRVVNDGLYILFFFSFYFHFTFHFIYG